MVGSVYDLVGEEGFDRLTRLFYEQVPEDEVLGPMYPPEEIEAARLRLRDFLVGRFGGPHRYILQRGHPRLRMRHMLFPIDQQARDRWMSLMTKALGTAGLPPDVTNHLMEFFASTATFLINRQSG